MSRPRSASKFPRLLSALGSVLLVVHGAQSSEPVDFAKQITEHVRTVTEKCGDAVCRIESEDDHGRLSGTGFLVDADGTLFTTYSVGGESDDIVVTVGSDKYPATRLLADPRSGIAILKVDAAKPLPFLPCGKARDLELSSPVVVLGYPLGLSLSPGFGIVAGFDIGFRGRYFATRHIRANVAVQRGQGGSPVLNLKGEAVGVLISTVDEQSGIFALPIEAACKVLRDFRASGHVRQGWLGADVRITDVPEHGSTARIRDVRKESPGFAGGLRSGDVILEVGDWKIANPEDVLNASFYVAAGEPLKMCISRAGKRRTLTVTPEDSPDGDGPIVRQEEPAALGAAEPASKK